MKNGYYWINSAAVLEHKDGKWIEPWSGAEIDPDYVDGADIQPATQPSEDAQ